MEKCNFFLSAIAKWDLFSGTITKLQHSRVCSLQIAFLWKEFFLLSFSQDSRLHCIRPYYRKTFPESCQCAIAISTQNYINLNLLSTEQNSNMRTNQPSDQKRAYKLSISRVSWQKFKLKMTQGTCSLCLKCTCALISSRFIRNKSEFLSNCTIQKPEHDQSDFFLSLFILF